MVKYLVNYEIYGERSCLQNLKDFCKERGVTFDYSEMFDSDSYDEYRELHKKEFGITDVFRAYITFKNIPNYKQILSEMDERDDIDIWIKIEM